MSQRIDPQQGAIVIGLMSGTSLDGISAAAARFVDTADGRITASLLATGGRSYSAEERARLEAAMRSGSARDYCCLHADLGEWLADAAESVITTLALPREQIAAVVSHGQTLWHEPGHSTWQIGDATRIAERTGCAVISDLRSRDVAAGGHGAPLVPMADVRLFSHPTAWRALQNLGGIGNVAVVPPSSEANTANEYAVEAFDTGPGVVIIDGVTRLVRPQLTCDLDGALARAGTPVMDVVHEMLQAPFFSMVPPKSTGREWFTREYIAQFRERCMALGASDEDVVATATAFTAHTIADQYQRFVRRPIHDIVLAGGGAKNPALVDAIASTVNERRVRDGSPPVAVVRFDDLFFDGEAKEAVAFALMGYLHMTGRSGNVPSATGARGPRVLGQYIPAT
ncbi:MAG: anhydro-N-acetylmuramic acid kinase [Gemmatimonadaceae bacterium]|nr:anhydro-N-acetylmuramic acid kinase [Gemmatimonadaceae bacterium]